MKLTLSNVKAISKSSDNSLTKRVCRYVSERWSEYDQKRYLFTDVLDYGCISGSVRFLIYYRDTVNFYNKYKTEINALLYENMRDIGITSLSGMFGDSWDKEDPLAIDTHNQNLLAWFGFEEALRNIARNFEDLENYI